MKDIEERLLDGGFGFVDEREIEAASTIKSLRAELAALKAAAAKVTCARCWNDGQLSVLSATGHVAKRIPCSDCADLRAILGDKP